MMNLFMFRNSLNIFKGTLLQFVKPLENSVCTHHDAGGITYLAILRLRLGFSHLRYHKFKHGFLDVFNLLCNCSTAIKHTVHYFLPSPNFLTEKNTFHKEIKIASKSIIDQGEIKIT